MGIYQGTPILDLDYAEDSNAETDMNVVMTDGGHFIEVQGTAEGHPFSEDEMNRMITTLETEIFLCHFRFRPPDRADSQRLSVLPRRWS